MQQYHASLQQFILSLRLLSEFQIFVAISFLHDPQQQHKVYGSEFHREGERERGWGEGGGGGEEGGHTVIEHIELLLL